MKTLMASISPRELAEQLNAGKCQLIDVREPVEFAEAHVNGARLISLSQLETRQAEIDRSLPVVVMCQAGKRGQAAAEKLRELGFADVRNLDGGINGWKSAGFATDAGARKVVPLMRQVQIVVGSCVLGSSLMSVFGNPNWIYLTMFFGAGLIFAGVTGFCGLALLLAKMPWNRMGPVPKPPQSSGSCCS